MNSLVVNPNDLIIADGNGPLALPAHLQGVNVGVSQALLAGMFTGGNRIGLKGSRFRLIVGGIEEGIIEDNYLDTILCNAAPAISRVYYAGAYSQGGDNAPPACYSADGIAPPDDVLSKQSDKCATCPQNVKGSKIVDGMKFKACGYFRRTVLFLAGDTIDRRVFKLDVKAQGLFGDKTANAQNLNDYIKSLETRGIDVGHVVTRISFDLNSSVPKLMFRAARYITPDELEALKDLVVSEEVKQMAIVNMQTVDLSGEESNHAPDEQIPAQEAAPAQQAAQQPVQQRPAQTATPAAQRPAQTAQRPVPTQQQATQRPQQVAVETVPQQVAQPTQTVQRTQAVQRPATQQTPVQRPVTQTPVVQEVNSNADLESILEGLD